MNTQDKEPLFGKKDKRKHTQTIFRSILLCAILVIFVIIGVVSILFLKEKKELDLSLTYNAQLNTQRIGVNSQTLTGFSSNLCVSKDNVSLAGVDIPDNEKAALFSLDDKDILYAKNMYEKAYPASVTKLMTALLTLKHGNMTDVVTITQDMIDLEDGSQVCGFKAGDQVTMNELFHGLLIHSGNDAALAIAKQIGGTTEHFVDMMNEQAKALGATGTHFNNPHGLHEENHYTTVYDIYLILNETMKYQDFLDIIQLSVYDIAYKSLQTDGTFLDSIIHVDATDKYLVNEVKAPKDVTVLGGKTGTTSQAGSCLALLSQNSYGKPYISIVLNAKNKTLLYDHMNQLLSKING